MLIGLTGRAGAGKSAIAEHLVVNHGWEAMSFAEPIYAALSVMLGMPEEELADRGRKERPINWLGKSPRELLQELGTGFGRQRVHEDLWVLILARRLDALRRLQPGAHVVISDVRFANEAAFVKQKGGVLWEVYGRSAYGVRTHESEAGVPPDTPRRSIYNGGVWADTVRQVEQALKTDMEIQR